MNHEYNTTSVRAVIRNGDNVLVEWFAPKSISFLPGGTVENGEDLRAALERELKEELEGIEVSLHRYLGHIGHIWQTSKGPDSCMNHYFEAQIIAGSAPRAKEPGRTVKWLSLTNDGELATLQPPKLQVLLRQTESVEWSCRDNEIDCEL